MTVGILGLGLIGGSLARAYAKEGHRVIAFDRDKNMLEFAELSHVIAGVLDESSLPECDLIFLAIYPEGCVRWLTEHAGQISGDALVIDCCGIKSAVVPRCFALAEQYGFTFVGGHPMAGTHFSGFKYSRSNLFAGAPMVLVPPRFDDMFLLDRVKTALAPCRFGSFSVTTAENHDRMIAFTSQMPHIISNAFIQSPTAGAHAGFSAGSYKDLTRVARLNAGMWAELFLCNREPLLEELNGYISCLEGYRNALEHRDEETLTALLDRGSRRKQEVDG